MLEDDGSNCRITLQETASGRRRPGGELGLIFEKIQARLSRLTGSKSEERFNLTPFPNNASSIEFDLICLTNTRDLRSTESLLTEKITSAFEANRRLAERMSRTGSYDIQGHILGLKRKLEAMRAEKKRIVGEIDVIERENEYILENMTVGRSRVLQRLQSEIATEREEVEKMTSQLNYMTNRLSMLRGERPRIVMPNSVHLPNLYGKPTTQQSQLPSLQPRASLPQVRFETPKLDKVTGYHSDWVPQVVLQRQMETWPGPMKSDGEARIRAVATAPIDELDEILSDRDLFNEVTSGGENRPTSEFEGRERGRDMQWARFVIMEASPSKDFGAPSSICS